MSRTLALLLATAVPFTATSAARAAEDTAKDIVTRAVKAHGGEEVLTKNKAGTAKNKGKIDIPGVGEAEFTQDMAFMMPDKLKDSMELKVAGQTISILTLVNGGKMLIEVNGKEVPVPDGAKDAIKDIGHLMKVARLGVLLKEKGFELSIIGEDKVEGKEVVGIRVAAKGQKDISLYFDKKTNLLIKISHRTVDATSGNEIAEDRIIIEYTKGKDGSQTPKKVLVHRDGKKFLEAEVIESTYVEKLDDSEFKK